MKLSWQHNRYIVYIFQLMWWQYHFDATLVNTHTDTQTAFDQLYC